MRIKRWASLLGLTLLAAGVGVGIGQSAQAAVPDRFGFVLWTGAVSQAQPAGTTVAPVPGFPGRWTVTFPNQGIFGGVVHVTAVHDALMNPPGRWCQAEGWGPVGVNEVVKVACYAPGGVLDPVPGFSVQFSRSSGVAAGGYYGYIQSTPVCGMVDSYNNVGAPNNCNHAGVGAYSVFFSAFGNPGSFDGSLQVTASNSAVGARCKVVGWGSSPNGVFARIYCFNSAGVLANTAFSVTYQFKRSLYGPAFPPNRFGYLWNAPPLGPASSQYNSMAGVIALAGGPPVWTATFGNLASTAPSNTQVTAYGPTSSFCGLHRPWFNSGVNVVAQVNCFTNAGVPINSGFFLSHNSRI